MARTSLDMPAANVVGAGKKSTFRLPIGRRYHGLMLRYSDLPNGPDDITEIAIKIGTEVIHRYSGRVRDDMNQHDGIGAAADGTGVLEIPFDRRQLLNRGSQEETALNTGVPDPDTGAIINSLSAEITLAGTAGAAATLDLEAEQSEPIAGGPGNILRILPETVTVNASGERNLPVDEYGSPQRQFLNRAWFKSANLTELEVQRDRVNVFKRTAAFNDNRLAAGVKVPQAGYFVYDNTELGFGGDMLSLFGVRDFRYIFQMAAPGDFELYPEYVGALR